MALRDFEGENYRYRSEENRKKTLNVVFCVNQMPGFAAESPINRMLEQVQLDLVKDSGFDEILTAYVHETPRLDVRPFAPFTKESTPVLKESIAATREHDTAKLLLMSLVMLEEQAEKDPTAENLLVLLTDEPFDRVQANRVIRAEKEGNPEEHLSIHPRFADLDFRFMLVMPEGEKGNGGERIERYIRQRQDPICYM